MSVRDFLSSYWRIILLVLFVAAAVAALFVPGGVLADGSSIGAGDGSSAGNNSSAENATTAEQKLTNLVYGLGLEGGTRIRAPVVGMTVGEFQLEQDRRSEIATTLQSELGVEPADVMVRLDQETGTYSAEVFTDNVSRQEFASALQSAGVDVTESDVRDGVTSQTRSEMIRTIDRKINQAGLSGGRVTESSTLDGQNYIVVEVPDRSPAELRNLLSDRGIVTVVAHYPSENGTQVNDTILEREDFDQIGSASYNSQEDYHYVPVNVRDEVADDYQQQLNQLGFTSGQGVGNCDIKDRETDEIDFQRGQPNYCLMTVVDGEVVDAHSMGRDLAGSMQSGEWASDPAFQMITPTQQDAQSLAIQLNAGALRAPLDFDNDQVFSLEPALADQFKVYSLLIGLLSVVTVSGTVYARYTDVRVAAPMIVTALAEVVILLGFAAAIRMPLELSHVAGFIAVVGTGVDDLIIIADEVMSEGDVNSRRVFESRFRKAFWVIGAAAATTILAMAPLAVLSLGDLRGFAIITILGVLVGVLITRPAYGDILRYLMTDK